MAEHKHLSSWVRGEHQSSALLSNNTEADICVVFVHGFFGNSVTTWGQFPDLCDADSLSGAERWARSDLYFFDYGAEKDFVKFSAACLATFLQKVFPRPDPTLFGLSPNDATEIRSPWLSYTRLILVGHSLGGVVIRECVENALSQASPQVWTTACELHLFASAHIGFQFSGFKDLLYQLSPKYFTSIPALWRAFNDLQKESNVLLSLKARTERAAGKHPQAAALLMYGRKEDVVIPAEFDCDPRPMEWREGHDHISICKPNPYFTDPFEFVIRDESKEHARA